MVCPGLSRRDLLRLVALPFVPAVLPGPEGSAAAVTARGGATSMKAALFPIATAPFPYDGLVPTTGEPFLDTVEDGRRGHLSPRGGLYFQDPTYSDSNVLVALPVGFDPGRPAVIVVFFHGNQSMLGRDVIGREQVLNQLQASHLNAALLAPQFAVDALDSSAGKFYREGAFARFLDEAAGKLADLWGDRTTAPLFSRMPVVFVAYSGGYNPAAYAATIGGAFPRITGMVLLDALYGEIERFAEWIDDSNRFAFFLSAYSDELSAENAELRKFLDERRVGYRFGLPRTLGPGVVEFLQTPGTAHHDYVTQAWVRDPLTDVLNRIAGFPRG